MGWVGLTCFKDGVRQIPVESIPGLQESGWKPSIDKVKVSVYWGGGGGRVDLLQGWCTTDSCRKYTWATGEWLETSH